MKKNIDKWNYYLESINKREKEFVDFSVKDKFTEFYSINKNKGEVITHKVDKFGYYDDHHKKMHYYGKKPTREEVHDISKIVQFPPILNEENIVVYCDTHMNGYKHSGMKKLRDIKENYYFDKFQAQRDAKVEKGKREVERNLIKNGTHEYCEYCGKFNNKNDMITGRIVFQNSRRDGTKFVDNKTGWYCREEGCFGYNQMAHEG